MKVEIYRDLIDPMQFILDCELNVLSFPLKISDNSMQRD